MTTKTYTFIVDEQPIDIDAMSFVHARYKLVEMFDKFDESFPATLISINIEKLLLERSKEQPGQLQTARKSV